MTREEKRKYLKQYYAENKETIKARTKKWYLKNKDRAKANNTRWRLENQESINVRSRKWKEVNKATVVTYQRWYHIRQKYGLSKEQWLAMLAAQGNCCAVCKSVEPKSKNWHTDHSHLTGKVRGILCQPCNLALHVDLTPELHRRLADYLEGNIP